MFKVQLIWYSQIVFCKGAQMHQAHARFCGNLYALTTCQIIRTYMSKIYALACHSVRTSMLIWTHLHVKLYALPCQFVHTYMSICTHLQHVLTENGPDNKGFPYPAKALALGLQVGKYFARQEAKLFNKKIFGKNLFLTSLISNNVSFFSFSLFRYLSSSKKAQNWSIYVNMSQKGIFVFVANGPHCLHGNVPSYLHFWTSS